MTTGPRRDQQGFAHQEQMADGFDKLWQSNWHRQELTDTSPRALRIPVLP